MLPGSLLPLFLREPGNETREDFTDLSIYMYHIPWGQGKKKGRKGERERNGYMYMYSRKSL